VKRRMLRDTSAVPCEERERRYFGLRKKKERLFASVAGGRRLCCAQRKRKGKKPSQSKFAEKTKTQKKGRFRFIHRGKRIVHLFLLDSGPYPTACREGEKATVEATLAHLSKEGEESLTRPIFSAEKEGKGFTSADSAKRT